MDFMTSGSDSSCACGRVFAQPSALANHTRSCTKAKKRLSSALDLARQKWTIRKRRRIALDQLSEETRAETSCVLGSAGLISNLELESLANQPALDTPIPNVLDSSHLSLVERRPWKLRANRQLPLRFRDPLPLPLPSLSPSSVAHTALSPTQTIAPVIPYQPNRHQFTSSCNVFGLFRRYDIGDIPIHDSDSQLSVEQLSNFGHQTASSKSSPTYWPYPNRSAFLLGDWFWNGGVQKSLSSFDDLMSIITNQEFNTADLQDVRWDYINAELGSENAGEWLDEDAGWQCTPISLSVPYQIRRGEQPAPDAGPKNYVVGDFYHRNLTSVIREKIAGLTKESQFHFEPYELLWNRSDCSRPVRVQGEIYTSPAFIEAHRELQASPREPGCNLPRVVVALMFASDGTLLTAFGSGKLWPGYANFGNDTKYHRCKPTCHLCEHIAYFQSLPDAFKEFASVQTAGGKAPSRPFMTHCHRELMHEQWRILLDDEFLDAWQHGIVMMCFDGILRRFYPRIFTYAADYPEKILIACIRNLGKCPCPRCLIPRYQIHNLGRPRDVARRTTAARVDSPMRRSKVSSARRLIYEKNMQINCAAVEDLLRDMSLVPTSNAFSDRLGQFGFDIHRTLLPDLMHEIELGGWKALFIHLLRMLESIDETLLIELDRRYRATPAFGRDSIRRFSANSSEMKKMAAHDFENLLQCAIPAFDGLFPGPHNSAIMDLLFSMGHWHGLAKLRMHNDLTLRVLDSVTETLGEQLRNFSQYICPDFNTVELRREHRARLRREAKGTSSRRQNTDTPNANNEGASTSTRSGHIDETTSSSAGDQPDVSAQLAGLASKSPTVKEGRRRKTLNINTYKFHSFGDYSHTIRIYGTTDSYSTEPGELEHRTPKSRYTRTSRKHFIKQLTKIERRQTRIRRIRERLKSGSSSGPPLCEDVPVSLESHHVIGRTQNLPVDLGVFVRDYIDDPAVKGFIPKLKQHIWPRIKSVLEEEQAEVTSISHNVLANPTTTPHGDPRTAVDFETSDTLNTVSFNKNRIYRHQIARFNHTTYDVRRDQDIIHPTTSHCNIMLLADNANTGKELHHHFLYAKVLGIYHANVIYTGQDPKDYRPRRMEFLWVRWYKWVQSPKGLRFDTLSFPPMASENSFGFVDPAVVLRGCHIVPAFSGGKVHADGCGLSRCAMDGEDWSSYYVNRFADRDMLMRYHWGLAVGHIYSHPERDSQATAQQLDPDIQDIQASADDGIDQIGLDITPDIQTNAQAGTTDDVEDLELHLEDLDDSDSDDSNSGSGADSEDADGELLEAMGIF